MWFNLIYFLSTAVLNLGALGALRGRCGVVRPHASWERPAGESKDRWSPTTDLLAVWLIICHLLVPIDSRGRQSPGGSQRQVPRVLDKLIGERST